MIALTLPEIRRLTIGLLLNFTRNTGQLWAWSNWRRRRQHQARRSHYRRRGHPLE